MRIGIDLGGTKIEAVVLNSNGDVICCRRLPTPKNNYQRTLSDIVALVHQVEADCSIIGQRIAVGLAAPGTISSETGSMKNCNSTCLNGQFLYEDLQRQLDRPVRLANDADCLALSEANDGAAMNCFSTFGVILGTGVGGAVVINKQLLQGPNGITGEWGHNPMPAMSFGWAASGQSRRCYCGRNDCVEAWLSGPGLEKSYYDLTGQQLPAEQIAAKGAAGDLLAAHLLDQYSEALAAALAVVINVLDPDAVVLGGGLSNIEALYQQVPQYWQQYVFTDRCKTQLLAAKYGDSSGVRGAAWLWA